MSIAGVCLQEIDTTGKGSFFGVIVYGQYYGDDGERAVVLMQWKSWQVETDGVMLWFPTRGEAVGHMHVTDYWRIKEMT